MSLLFGLILFLNIRLEAQSCNYSLGSVNVTPPVSPGCNGIVGFNVSPVPPLFEVLVMDASGSYQTVTAGSGAELFQTSVPGGTYTVQIQNMDCGLISIGSFTVNNPPCNLSIQSLTASPDGCGNTTLSFNFSGSACNGEFTAQLQGTGFSNPSLFINTGPGTYSFNNISPDQYTLTIDNGSGGVCTASQSITVNPPACGISGNASIASSPTGFACSDGSILLSASGPTCAGFYYFDVMLDGIPLGTLTVASSDIPYLYTGLPMGTYSFSLSGNPLGCSVNLPTLDLFQPLCAINRTSVSTQNSTTGFNGEVSIEYSGYGCGELYSSLLQDDGTGVYLPFIAGPFSGNNIVFSGLPAGNFRVITNAHAPFGPPACSDTYDFTLTDGSTPCNLSVNINSQGPVNVCPGGLFILEAPAGFSSYAWSDGISFSNQLNTLTPGTYFVTVTDANGCSAISNSITLGFFPQPSQPEIITIGASPACELDGANLQVQNIISGINYNWSTPNSSGPNAVVFNQNPVTVTATNQQGCEATSDPYIADIIAVTTPFLFSATGQLEACSGDSILLYCTSGAAIWYRDGQSINHTGNTYYAKTGGSYYVVVPDNCGPDQSNTVTLMFNQAYTITLTPNTDQTICQGQSVQLCASSDGPITWSTGQSGNCITVSNAGFYAAIAGAGSACESQSSIIEIVVNPNPTAPVLGSPTFNQACFGETVILTATAADPITWTNGMSGSPISIYVDNQYSLRAIATNAQGCTAQSPVVEIIPLSRPTISIQQTVGSNPFCLGQSVQLTANVNTGTVQWVNGPAGNQINLNAPGFYTAIVTSGNGCTNSANFTLNAQNCFPGPEILPQFCDAPIALSTSFACTPVSGAVQYEFSYYEPASLTQVAVWVQSNRTTRMNLVPGLQWNTDYYVSVRAYVSGAWTGYGPFCQLLGISDPAINGVPNTRLRSSDCGYMSFTPSSVVTALSVAGATSYQFEFRQAGNLVAIKTQSSNQLNFASLSTNLAWGQNYQVSVRARIGTLWGNFSTVCNIGLIPDPAISGIPPTQLVTSNCGRLNYTLSNSIAATSVSNATAYDFEFYQGGNLIAVRTTSTRVCALAQVSPSLQAGQTYQVRVRAKISGVTGPFGAFCTIGIISGSRADTGEEEMSETEPTEENPEWNLYPNPFNESLIIEFKEASEQDIYRVLDIQGRVIETGNLPSSSRLNTGGDWPAGMYIIEWAGSKGMMRSKVIKK